MKLVFLLSIFALGFSSFASEKALHAHVHGESKISIVFDGMNAQIDLDSPGESLFGFEYRPKTKQEKETQVSFERKWKELFGFITFPSELKCQVVQSQSKIDYEKNHSDVEAQAEVKCEKVIKNTTLTFNLVKEITHLNKIEVEIINDKQTKHIVTKNNIQIKI